MRRPVVTNSQRAEILRRVRSGDSYAAVGRELGIYSSTVRRICVKAGVKSEVKQNYGPTPWRTTPCIMRRTAK